MGTLQLEMSHAEGGVLGIGDLDDARFARGIDLLVSTKNLPYYPKAGELFDRSFLPPLNDRVWRLVRAKLDTLCTVLGCKFASATRMLGTTRAMSSSRLLFAKTINTATG